MEWHFVIPGPPVPWMRAMTRGKQRFTPKRQRDYQARIVTAARHQAGIPTLAGAVELEVTAYLERTRPFVYGSGDWDNFGKQVSDALQRALPGHAPVLQDDSQVVRGQVMKVADMENPRLEVLVRGTPATQSDASRKLRRTKLMKLVPSYQSPRSP